ncbi:AAA family ATPase [Umezakia ovalisporum]|jgi:ATP-dependent Zn protease|uniref:ATP-binding protein n=2 Tax=Umezakia ovalisporum TaxID=75695 RepID=A0AA43KDL3_9CYAN|nr:AAA family ATPase [Umezakia ovalisporum]MBI1241961.1 AAA family ATPase [Nostoc sp. RI_552]MDH6056768.1 ATP-binding protein [Umezakia ovalisporum FSS-43]MDH6062699.1 ATP-binding protein [Umezakia ovalisporum FSS-62]MDH6066088.1 ATP-binding protein [Umezakia ovalisporum APH033B]MDH6072183.1 ATP-binding protein [Umezakia ovalisporum CobakiLakeA]
MEFDYFRSNESTPNNNRQSLLTSGWRPFHRELDWEFLGKLLYNDTRELTQKTLNLVSNFAEILGRNNYAWWANLLNVVSDSTQYEVEKFWNYITPEPKSPDHRYKDILSTETPIVQFVSRSSIPIDYVLNRLQEIIVLRVLELLDCPDIITQCYLERDFYFPVKKFVNWERIEVINTVYAYWSKYDTWLQIESYERGKRYYTLMSTNISPLINKATYDLAVMLSGYQSRVGKVHSQYSIRTFPVDIQNFTDTVQQAVLTQNQLAVVVHGEPGTGKTVWTQAVAKEIIVPLGYVIFILDHDAIANFVPPNYLERICIIVNEADNLAQNRACEVAQYNNKTEHILSLLDGTLYQSVIDDGGIQLNQKLVVLMTCNTTERLDPAMLRKGRVDLIYEFTKRFV